MLVCVHLSYSNCAYYLLRFANLDLQQRFFCNGEAMNHIKSPTHTHTTVTMLEFELCIFMQTVGTEVNKNVDFQQTSIDS